MNPYDDALYRFHQLQALRRGLPPWAYADFRQRWKGQSETDLTQLIPPPPDPAGPGRRPQFNRGMLCVTPQANEVLPLHELLVAVVPHAVGDWGEINSLDWLPNERATINGGRICSAYHSRTGQKFWVITAAGRSPTTVLLSEVH
jgi:hypothetical protein